MQWDRMLPFYVYATPVLFFVSPLLFPLVMMGVGALWASSISERVIKQQEIGIHDLLYVLPGGRWAANWATACGSIHQSFIFEGSWIILRGMLVVGFLLVIGISMVVGQFISEDAGLANLRWFILDMVALFVGYGLHYIQTMALSPLVGLLVPTYVRNRVEARLGSAGLYLGIQIGTYLLGGLLFYFVPLLVSGWATSIRILTPYLIVVFILREALIRWLWMVLLRRLSLTTAEKEDIWTLVNQYPE